MGLFDSDLTLPGVATDILPTTNSSGDVEYGTTESITIIGTAFNGPVGEPQAVGTPEMAKYIFGESFDATTKREASLVAEIKDAYDRGCRNIYAVRVGGKEMYKDYELAIESNLKLRVSGYFPHNGNKHCFMTYQSEQGSDKAMGPTEGIIKIYKPASRTVISEKIAGVVDSIDSLLVTEINLDSEGYTKDSRLCDVLETINKKNTNNVLKFTLVDENGIVKNNSSKEVQSIPVGALFPGIYTLCRKEAAKNVKLVTDIEVVMAKLEEGEDKLYPLSTDLMWKRLKVNTDPSKPYPISAENFSTLQSLLNIGINITSYDFLRAYGEIDKIATVDKEDYEQVDLSGIELYKELGSGFLRTATLKKIGTDSTGAPKFKVIQAPDGDSKRVVSIDDGIYSKLQMHETDYVVLAAATMETDVTGKLPKKSEFKKAVSNGYKLSANETDYIIATAKIDLKDTTSQRTQYDLSLEEIDGLDFPDTAEVIEALSNKKIIRIPALNDLPETKLNGIEEGLLAFCHADKKIYKVVNKMFVAVEESLISGDTLVLTEVFTENTASLKLFKHSSNGAYVEAKASDVGNKVYITAISDAKANVYELSFGGEASGDIANIKPFISLQDLANGLLDEEDITTVCIESDMPILNETFKNNTYISVKSTEIEYASVEEFVDTLNSLPSLKDKFLFESANSEISTDELAHDVPIYGKVFNKEAGFEYDTTLYIPYTTTDNFARHLAQHCMYTTMKNHACHGVIGCDKLNGITLSTISERVNEICDINLDMYAKKANGNNILDSDNNPWPIGRCISTVFAQYPVSTGSGYDYISSGASGYAGMVSTLPAERSSTNQEISISTNDMMFSLSNYQLTKLNAAGIVCIKRVGNRAVVVDGITQAPIESAYRRLSTTKTINTVAKLLKNALQPFIGTQQSPANMNSLETAIKSTLNSVKGLLINDYDYKVNTDSQSNLLEVVNVSYIITPAAEIKQVRNSITISNR